MALSGRQFLSGSDNGGPRLAPVAIPSAQASSRFQINVNPDPRLRCPSRLENLAFRGRMFAIGLVMGSDEIFAVGV